MPQSRAAMAVARALAPARGRARARPVRRARRQDDPPGRADGQRGRDRRRRAAPRPRRGAARRPRSAWGRRSSTCARSDATQPRRAGDVRPRARRPAVLATSARSPRAPTRAGARPAARQALAALQREILDAGAEAVRPGGTLVYSTCTISPVENEQRRGSLPGRSRGVLAPTTWAPTALSGSIRPCRSTCRRSRTATAPTASSSRGSRAHERRRPRVESARPATSRGCGRPTSRAATAA